MARKTIVNPGWPFYAQLSGFEPAMKAGDLLFISGCVGADEEGKVVAKGDIKAQTRRALENIKAVCEAAGGSLDDVIDTLIFVTDRSYMEPAIEVCSEYFKPEAPVAGTGIVISGLFHEDYLIEIRAVAAIGSSKEGT